MMNDYQSRTGKLMFYITSRRRAFLSFLPYRGHSLTFDRLGIISWAVPCLKKIVFHGLVNRSRFGGRAFGTNLNLVSDATLNQRPSRSKLLVPEPIDEIFYNPNLYSTLKISIAHLISIIFKWSQERMGCSSQASRNSLRPTMFRSSTYRSTKRSSHTK